ncbi:MAG: N-acetyltransferase [Acidobacteria bacterium]|nr:MAG: N-acetyltransferase [Acidobacteriota bacterium]
MSVFIHPTAIVEDGVEIGDGTSVWSHVHVRGPSRIGRECIIGEKSYIAYGVEIGDRVKINAFVYICTAVTIESGVMVSAGTIFTNDRNPRAATPDLSRLLPSEPNEETLPTRVRAGATIGAGAVIGCGLEIGEFAMVGMGSVVTKSVAPHSLVFGNPARPAGLVCACGKVLVRFPRPGEAGAPEQLRCGACGRRYAFDGSGLRGIG